MKRGALAIVQVIFIAGVCGATETADFARYQPLIDRSPFGQVQGTPTDAPPNWLANYVFVGLTQSNSGDGAVQAIISTKDNSHWYFRTAGEMVDPGVKVLRVDQQPPKLVLQNGLETGTLTFQDRPTVAPAPGAPPPGAPATAPSPNIRRIPFRRGN